MPNGSKRNSETSNKGVNAYTPCTPSRCPMMALVQSDTENSISSSSNPRSLTEIKRELVNAIETMGPSTPYFTNNTQSSDADNEDSTISNTEEIKMEHNYITYSERTISTLTTPREFDSRSVNCPPVMTSMESTQTQTSSRPNNNFSYHHEQQQVMVRPEDFYSGTPCMAGTGPPHICLNPACMSGGQPGGMVYQGQSNFVADPNNNMKYTVTTKKKGFIGWIKERSFDRLQRMKSPGEYYKISVAREDDHSPPRRLTFDLVDGIPKPEAVSVATNTKKNPITTATAKTQSDCMCGPRVHTRATQSSSLDEMKHEKNKRNCNEKRTSMDSLRRHGHNHHYQHHESRQESYERLQRRSSSDLPLSQQMPTPSRFPRFNLSTQRTTYYDSNGDTRVDFYYFDHGNAQYFHTTDTPPVMMCEVIAEKTERYTARFWAEVFTSIHVGIAFFTTFILQVLRSFLFSIVRPLTVGILQLISDYFFKPLLTTIFNAILQPILILFYNVATSLRDCLDPVAEGMGYFFREIAVLFRAIRLITVKTVTKAKNGDDRSRDVEGDCDCG